MSSWCPMCSSTNIELDDKNIEDSDELQEIDSWYCKDCGYMFYGKVVVREKADDKKA